MIVLLQAAAFVTVDVPAAPYEEVQVAALECLEQPKTEAARDAYAAYLDSFSYDTIKDKKPDPELLALVDAEVAQCAEEQSWVEESKSRAKGWVLSRLLQAGGWSILPLEGEKRARLVAALDKQGEAGVAIAGLMSNPSSGQVGYSVTWTADLLREAGLEDEDSTELGRALGIYLVGTAMRRTTREKFAELNGLEEE